ncbi:hypothetical protein IQ252_13030 [Tychonema sp. LEGE 07203]|nr:hypothetical protein [Tychonema sp. LEGE 07203]
MSKPPDRTNDTRPEMRDTPKIISLPKLPKLPTPRARVTKQSHALKHYSPSPIAFLKKVNILDWRIGGWSDLRFEILVRFSDWEIWGLGDRAIPHIRAITAISLFRQIQLSLIFLTIRLRNKN